MQKRISKQFLLKLFFAVYILFVIKVIIFKYPLEQLRAIADTWQKDVILEGLGTANFMPFRTIKMYIDYAYKLNSVENLAGNLLVFVPLGFLLPLVFNDLRRFSDVFINVFTFVLGIEVFQLFSAFGAFDVDDILLNCVGAMTGYGFYKAAVIADAKRKSSTEEKHSTGRVYAIGKKDSTGRVYDIGRKHCTPKEYDIEKDTEQRENMIERSNNI